MSRSPRRSVRRTRLASLAVATCLLAVGCSWNGLSIDVDGVDARWISVPGPGDREAIVVTASGDDSESVASKRARPLFVVLHGAGQDAETMTTYGGWSEAARDHHAVAAFAQGVENTFNAGTCCGAASARGIDDVGYLDRLITTVSRKVGADPSKVYMVGFSNGGMMTYRYVCEGATHLLGAASLEGTNAAGCTPTRPTTFLQVSGTKDTTVPVSGVKATATDVLGPLQPADQAVRHVADAFACTSSHRQVIGAVASATWSPCADGVTVRFDLISGLVHMYPFQGPYSATNQALAMWGFS